MDKSGRDNYSNQHNPNNSIYWKGRGYADIPSDWEDCIPDRHQDKCTLDNYSKQLNPNNDLYWKSRGYSGRPSDEETDGSSTAASGSWCAIL